MAVYAWLVNDGNLWRSVIGWATGFVLGALVAWHPLRHHRRSQAAIADALDTTTPGGLGAVVEAIKHLEGGEGSSKSS